MEVVKILRMEKGERDRLIEEEHLCRIALLKSEHPDANRTAAIVITDSKMLAAGAADLHNTAVRNCRRLRQCT